MRREHPGDADMWVSHESIYRDVYRPSRKAFDASMFHRLCSDRPTRYALEAKRFRHVAVAIPEVRVCRGIAVSSGQQIAQPQQGQFVCHDTRTTVALSRAAYGAAGALETTPRTAQARA